ncbi:MAG: radical SAM protein, partial [Terriglobales bacterium]
SVEEMRLMRRAGLEQICQGVESASPKVLKLMNKSFQNFADIYRATERCLQAGIRPSFNIIFGYPGEGIKERQETVSFIMDVCQRFPGAEFWTNIFTPYPGAPVIQRAQELGIEVPKSFEGWADYFPRYTVLPWLKGKEHARVQTMRDYLRLSFDRRTPLALERRSWLRRSVRRALGRLARWRLEHNFYAFPFELWLKEKVKPMLVQTKPSVDAKRFETAAQTSCA